MPAIITDIFVRSQKFEYCTMVPPWPLDFLPNPFKSSRNNYPIIQHYKPSNHDIIYHATSYDQLKWQVTKETRNVLQSLRFNSNPQPNTMPNTAVKWQQHYPVLIEQILVQKLYIMTAFSCCQYLQTFADNISN